MRNGNGVPRRSARRRSTSCETRVMVHTSRQVEPTTFSSTGSTRSGYSSSSTVAAKPNSTLASTASTGTWRLLIRASPRGASPRAASEWIMREAP